MRFATPTMTGAIRAALQKPTYRMAQKQTFVNLRQYSSQVEPKKSGSGSKLLLATLIGAGVVGGIAYNSSETKVVPVLEEKVKEKAKTTAFDPSAFVSLKLIETESISHNTKLLRFAVPEGQDGSLPVASCVIVKYQDETEKPIIRPYTPVSEEEGHVDFIIKKYDDGKLTPIIHDLKPGDSLQFKGPIPKYDWEKLPKKNVGMIAGGTGITPMLQIIRRVFDAKSTDKDTKITLIFANQTEDDILLKPELDKIAKENPDRFKVVYALDRASEDWKGITGYVTKEVVEAHLPGPKDNDAVIFVCGPPLMVKSIAGAKNMRDQGDLGGVLKELGYAQENVFKF
ncbi:MAG: hypothetical protein EXX96DRAFT_517977 [Benjaminiella poitrasii]|nr:MAG: hypothetical protein EXX96DRAFT_517977 [Benjaminiella poitrasii]